jgi:hypothetical protein
MKEALKEKAIQYLKEYAYWKKYQPESGIPDSALDLAVFHMVAYHHCK